MVDWHSPQEIARDALAFTRLMHALLGLYTWEWITSLDFDWEFITRKRRFQWAMTFYFLGRYFMLFSIIGIVIGLDATREINCQALYTFNTIIGASAIGLASINLSIRTMAVWSRRWYIVIPLIVLILGHFSLLLQAMTLKAVWMTGQGCVITYTNNTILTATYIYTMTFDLIIMVLTAVKLSTSTVGESHSKLKKFVFRDGLIYFIAAFLVNLLATTFILLDLNPIMSVIANIPATVISTIAACRIVRRLSNFSPTDGESFTATPGTSGICSVLPKVSTLGPEDGIQIQMETFPSSDLDGKTTPSRYSGPDHKEQNDPESQVIRGKFDTFPTLPP